MKKNKYLFVTSLLFACLYLSTSCNNDGPELVSPSYRSIELSCGSEIEIPVLAETWSIESVQEVSIGIVLSDKNGDPLSLDGIGKVEAKNGWLSLIRNNESGFTIRLKENFDPKQERKLEICINSNGEKDYVKITQKGGQTYKLIKAEFDEIEDKRENDIQVEDSIILYNNSTDTDKLVTVYDKDLFKNIVESSQFESDDYGAFAWMPKEGVQISGPNFSINGINGKHSLSWDNIIPYVQGITTRPVFDRGSSKSSCTLKPNTSIKVVGKIKYYKRICNYTLTIENTTTGTQFNVNGIWTQVLPFDQIIVFSDKLTPSANNYRNSRTVRLPYRNIPK